MKIIKWEEIKDDRFKYENQDPKWNKVYFENPTTPLGSSWKFNYCILADRYKAYIDSIINYDANENDVWICSYPKSGTTWAQEMIWLIQNGFDFKTGKEKLLFERSPTLRQVIKESENITSTTVDHYNIFGSNTIKLNNQCQYLIKNHLPVGLLPKKIWETNPKIIYIARNPRDVALSFYNHYKIFFQYTGSNEEFYSLFLDNLVEFGPWANHVWDYWQLRDKDNVLFLTYEEMKNDLSGVIRRCAQFLNKPVTEEQIHQSLEYLHINNMRETSFKTNQQVKSISEVKLKDYATKFFRKGEVGSYKSEMASEIVKQFEELVENELKECDIF